MTAEKAAKNAEAAAAEAEAKAMEHAAAMAAIVEAHAQSGLVAKETVEQTALSTRWTWTNCAAEEDACAQGGGSRREGPRD